MLFLKRWILLLLFFTAFTAAAQVNFKQEWTDADPVKSTDSISVTERIGRHEAYLEKAKAQKNITLQFYGNLYLYSDHLDEQDYAAARYLIMAEDMANKSGNPDWIGNVKSRTGWLAHLVNKDSKKAIADYWAAFKNCSVAKDSVCMGTPWNR